MSTVGGREIVKVLAVVPTKNRYFTTLPLCLASIMNQTKLPDKLLILDDGEQKDLRNEPVYKSLFLTMQIRGLAWEVKFGEKRGQAHSHQKSIEYAREQGFDCIWRLDDDNVAEAGTLESLLSLMTGNKSVGAVGGLVLDPLNYSPFRPTLASNKIEDWGLCLNIQWFPSSRGVESVDHLYSTFLYRVQAAAHGYNPELSVVGHTEETQFTYEMKRNGWELLVTPHTTTWHFRAPQGGIRSYQDGSLWARDTDLFLKKLKKWRVKQNEYKLFVLDNGLGDHLCFLQVFDIIREKYKNHKIVIACCYPDVFEDLENVSIISIADAKNMKGDIEPYSLYKWMAENNMPPRLHLCEGFLGLYDCKPNKLDWELFKAKAEKRSSKKKTIVISPFSRPLHTGGPSPKDYLHWKELVKKLKKKGYQLIQVGMNGEEDLGCNKFLKGLKIKEIKRLIVDCDTWIGIDNFFPHLAAFYPHKPGVVIFSISDPVIAQYPQNVNLLKHRGYLRPAQFDMIENSVFNKDSYMDPNEVVKAVEKVLK